ncbi:iron-containing redox enzyme family protein [Leptothoe spongobia]|uniref:Iron-containing redox enzyme family protein n=1 Tax=Leptothoe spongobia TAU-MAC 1115 TaxID=1967444 RepID=A0A947DCA4_9CYAN|nr:iron-containing redox enzyme family protein [Leptothoe spongobia]MBT9314437.1 iron-containing redox enzyme family protein [Leptothoe spongobia TAU-MAC 1115]
MPSAQRLEEKPLSFKDQVLFKFKDTQIEIRHRDQGCAITIPEEGQQEILHFLRLLQIGNLSLKQLSQACPDIQNQIPELLDEFIQRGLLTETRDLSRVSGVTGRQFYRELSRFLKRFKQQFPPSPLSQQLADGTLSREQLIGYALESYHVTHLCPRLLAPALAQYETTMTQNLLQEFFVSELHHDHLIKKSLKSVGIESEQLAQLQPLPMTFTVCAALGVFARQHPLSFKTALMLFEEDDKVFHELFKQRCQALNMPSDFYRPILLHAHINEEGAHDQITADLLTDVPYVSPEEQLLVKKNMTLLIESMILRTYEILDYYGNPDNIIPRCFMTTKESRI